MGTGTIANDCRVAAPLHKSGGLPSTGTSGSFASVNILNSADVAVKFKTKYDSDLKYKLSQLAKLLTSQFDLMPAKIEVNGHPPVMTIILADDYKGGKLSASDRVNSFYTQITRINKDGLNDSFTLQKDDDGNKFHITINNMDRFIKLLELYKDQQEEAVCPIVADGAPVVPTSGVLDGIPVIYPLPEFSQYVPDGPDKQSKVNIMNREFVIFAQSHGFTYNADKSSFEPTVMLDLCKLRDSYKGFIGHHKKCGNLLNVDIPEWLPLTPEEQEANSYKTFLL